MTDAADSRWVELAKPRFAAATVTICLGVALFAFNEFLVSTALPTAVKELRGVALISWSLTFYLVFAIMAGASAAVVKQRLGTRTTLIASAIVFLIGTLLAAAASSMVEVVAGRILQGAGEGMIASICFTLIPELFPSRLVPKVFGVQAVVWAAAAFGGPLAAGMLTELVSWRAAFLVSVPLGTIFIGLVALVVPRRAAGGSGGFDVPVLRLVTIGGGILLVSVAGIANVPAVAAGLIFAAGAVLAGAVLLDRRSRLRLLPRDAFSFGSVLGTGLWVVLLMPMAQAATAVYLVLTLQLLWGYGPTFAGAIGALMAVCWSGTAIIVASVRSATTRLNLIRSGPALLTLGLAGVLVALRSDQLALLLTAQMAIGTGFGLAWGLLNQTVMEAGNEEECDRASALLPTMQSAGYAIGAAVAGLTANAAGYTDGASAEVMRQAVTPIFAVAVGLATISLAVANRMGALKAAQSPP
jgi:MFS family permease